MSNALYALNAILPTFFIVAIGYLLKNKWVLTDEFCKLGNKLCFNVLLPCLVFRSVYTSQFIDNQYLYVAVFCFVAVVIANGIIMILVPRLTKSPAIRGTVVQGCVRSNTLLLGLPIAMNMFDPESGAPVAMVIAVIVPLYNVMAVIALTMYHGEKKTSLWSRVKQTFFQILKNPLIIAVLVALLIKLININLPNMVYAVVNNLASIASTFALIILGSSLTFKRIGDKKAYIVLADTIKLVILPIVMVGIAVLIGFRGLDLGIVFIVFATPTAVSSYIMAENMNGDGELAAQIAITTTVLAVVTMPIGAYILKVLNFI